MLKVGLTGGIGCGKSTAVDAFRVLGVPIVDADKISKNMVQKGAEALNEIARVFGGDLILDSGELNRSLLKQKIFSDSNALKKLEAILHPRIKAEINRQILSIKDQAYVIVDIPLLVEKNYQHMFDQIIVVDCLPEQQVVRVSLRDDLSESDIKKKKKNQADQEERKKFATVILDNTKSKEFLNSQINRLHTELVALS